MAWQFNDKSPVFMQIVRRIRTDILLGKYPPDTQVPSVRQFAFEASVNPNTMQRALSELEDEGLLVARGTIGRFVTSDVTVLNEAREKVKRDALEELVESAFEIGITKQELLAYIEEVDHD